MNKILALCDTEEEYAQHMTAFLKSRKGVPWEIYTYTKVDGLVHLARDLPVEILVVAENAYTEEVRSLAVAHTVLLNESGVIKWGSVKNVDKYQKAETVFKEILSVYIDMAETPLPGLAIGTTTRLVGMYSPVRRCLQTSFALALGQMLADKHRTLYLNFEHYAGITEILPDVQARDLSDLLYFLTAEKDKFLLRMQTILQKKGELDYIPPMKAGQNLITVTSMEWQSLIQRIMEMGEYEYVILDLSENIQGLFDILRMCYKVLTFTKEDEMANSKIIQYEQVLALYEYEDVLGKTCKYQLPMFRRLPDVIEQFTKGDLAEYVRKVLREVLG